MRDRVLSWLSNHVSNHRLEHILGVEQMSIQLARHHQVDESKAAQAGLLHDLAKFFKPTQLLQLATENGIEIDSVCAANPHLLHADVSAIVAQEQFDVTDRDILDAIGNHTLGRPQMNNLSCIVFVADTLEPGRGHTPELEAMRQTSQENLHQSVHQTCDYSLKYLLKTRRTIHPRTIMTRNWALQVQNPKSKI